jgi:uncharacterized protein with PQ loop repeat
MLAARPVSSISPLTRKVAQAVPAVTMNTVALVVGWLAAGLSCFISAPQLVRILRARTTSGVSMLAWQMALGGNLTWGLYGVVHGFPNQWVPNVLLVTITLVILGLFRKHVGASWPVLVLPGLLLAATTTSLDRWVGPIAFSVAAFLPAAVSLVSQLRTTAGSEDVTGLSLGNQWIGFVNQSVWVLWAVLVSNQQVLLVGSMALLLIVANLSLATMRKSGSWGPVRREGLRISFSRA